MGVLDSVGDVDVNLFLPAWATGDVLRASSSGSLALVVDFCCFVRGSSAGGTLGYPSCVALMKDRVHNYTPNPYLRSQT